MELKKNPGPEGGNVKKAEIRKKGMLRKKKRRGTWETGCMQARGGRGGRRKVGEKGEKANQTFLGQKQSGATFLLTSHKKKKHKLGGVREPKEGDIIHRKKGMGVFLGGREKDSHRSPE